MQDEAGRGRQDHLRPADRPPLAAAWRTSRDLPEELLEEIKHFFDVYKALEPGKASSTAGFEGRRGAWREIERSRARHLESE